MGLIGLMGPIGLIGLMGLMGLIGLIRGQRIFPVGRGRLIKNKVLPVCT